MQPYQRAGELMRQKSEQPMNLLKKGAGLGLKTASALGGASLLSQALPFLAEGISAETAIKGLTSLSPKFGKFIDKALKNGQPFNEIKSFISEKLSTAQESTPKSLFEKLVGDIDLASLDENMQKQLGFVAPIAHKLEKEGNDENSPAVKKLKEKIQKILKGKPGVVLQESARFGANPAEQTIQPTQASQSMAQPGQGQQALMAILQKIQAQRGAGG